MISPVFFPAPDLLVNFLLSFLLSTTFILNNNLKKRHRALLDSVRSEVKQKNLSCWYSQVVPSLRKQTNFPPVALRHWRYFSAAQSNRWKICLFSQARLYHVSSALEETVHTTHTNTYQTYSVQHVQSMNSIAYLPGQIPQTSMFPVSCGQRFHDGEHLGGLWGQMVLPWWDQ